MHVYRTHKPKSNVMTDPTRHDPCNCSAIRKAARHVTQLYDQHLAGVGLTVTQFAILARLGTYGALTINDLAGRLAMDRTTLGRIIRPLERDGLVQISSDPRDGRRRPLALTEEGRVKLDAARPLWACAQDRFESAYGREPASSLRTLLAGLLATDLAGGTPSSPNEGRP